MHHSFFSVLTVALVLSIGFSHRSEARHVPVDSGGMVIEQAKSQVKPTPKGQQITIGETKKPSFNLLGLRDFFGDLFWNRQDELSQNIYDSLSDFTVSANIVNKPIFSGNATGTADWETTMRRKI